MDIICSVVDRIGPQRQAKLARLRHMEERLLRHPLSLYPHLQESIPAEVFIVILYMNERERAGQMHTPNAASHFQEKNNNMYVIYQ